MPQQEEEVKGQEAGAATPAAGATGSTPSEQLRDVVEGAAGATGAAQAAGATGEPGGATGATGGPAKSPHTPDWRDGRMAKMAEQKKANEAEIRRLTEQLAKAQGQQGQQRSESPEDFEARVNAEADRRARAMSQTAAFNKQAAEAQAEGEKAFGKEAFQRSVDSLRRLAEGGAENVAAHQQLIIAAMATGEAAKLVHVLGQDPDEAARIMGLEPVQMGVALARLAAKDAPQSSTAPAPIKPLGTRGPTLNEISADDKDKSDDLSMKTWVARREADIKAGKSRARA